MGPGLQIGRTLDHLIDYLSRLPKIITPTRKQIRNLKSKIVAP